MKSATVLEAEPSEHDAEMAKIAQRCIMAALDHSRAQKIALISDDEDVTAAPTLELPPKALRFFADMLGMMAQRRPIVLMPENQELTTQDVANFLNVSRPFVVKQIEEGRLNCRRVGRHRRVEFNDVLHFQAEMKAQSNQALQALADINEELGLDY